MYHYRVASTDALDNSAASVDATFVTVAAGTTPITVTVSGTFYQLNPNQGTNFEFENVPDLDEDWLLGIIVKVTDTGGGTLNNAQITSAVYDGFSAIVQYFPPAAVGLYSEWQNVSALFPVLIGSVSPGSPAMANLVFDCGALNVPLSSLTGPPFPFPSGQAHSFTVSGFYYDANSVKQTFSVSLRSLAAPLY